MAKKEFLNNKKKMISKARQASMGMVAVASIIIGACVVMSWFLIQKMFFHQEVIGEQNKTIKTLELNYQNIQKISQQVASLQTDELLLKKKVYDTETAWQVILDALPDRANSPALGESLVRSILNVPGVEVDQLSLSKTEDEVGGEFEGQGSTSYNQEYNDVKEPAIYFRIKISGTAMGLNQVLKNIENSIRPIIVDKIEFQSGGKDTDDAGRPIPVEKRRHWLTIDARSFYSYEAKLEMKEKTVGNKKR